MTFLKVLIFFKKIISVIARSNILPSGIKRSLYKLMHKMVELYILRVIGEDLAQYKNKELNEEKAQKNKTFWIFWWQEQVPEMIAKNIQLLKQNTDADVVFINKTNIADYLEIPQIIYDKIDSGDLSLALFSDVLLTGLLYQHGGIWVDSTIMALGKIDDKYFDYEFFTPRGIKGNFEMFVSRARWQGYCMGGKAGKDYFLFVHNMLIKMIIAGKIPDYFLIDYLIDIAYTNNVGGLKTDLDVVDDNNQKVLDLESIINLPYDSKVFEQLTQNTVFFKSSWKHEHVDNVDGSETYFGHIQNLVNS